MKLLNSNEIEKISLDIISTFHPQLGFLINEQKYIRKANINIP